VPPRKYYAQALEEIVVSARKRNETLEDAPISVKAFTEAEIQSAGISTPQDFIDLTPNVTLVQTQNAGNSFLNIRGVSQARNSELSAAVLIDGVLMSNPTQFNQQLFDIEQIEVLRGPRAPCTGATPSAAPSPSTPSSPATSSRAAWKPAWTAVPATRCAVP
jgi:iron complex outermembrane receptor protein